MCQDNNNCVISLVIFPAPTISIEPSGVITLDRDVRMVCSVTNEQGGGSYIFRKSSGSFSQTVNSSSNSATLNIPKVTFTDEGDYQCQFKVRISNDDFSTNFSSDVSLYIKGVFLCLFCMLTQFTLGLKGL